MADLRRRGGRRGQILLLGAFALAALFVTLALILNAVIYTENLATRADSRTSDAVAHSKSVERATVDLLESVNEHNTTEYSDLHDELERGFENFTEGTARFKLTSGVVITGTIRNKFNGTWLTQTNASRNFTNNDTAETWSVESANGAKAFRIKLNVTDELADLGPNSTENFSVRASDGTDNWTLAVGNKSADPTINWTDANGNTGECEWDDDDPTWINVSEGTMAGEDCDGLDFGGDLGTIESIEFDNADNIEGTYRLMVKKNKDNIDDTDFAPAPPAEGPFRKPAIYGAVVGIEYETTTLVYRTDRRVVPGEIDG